jgi:transposase InsO family protein
MADAWRDLTDNGTVSVTYPSFTRQLKQHLPPAVDAGLTAHGSQKGREAYLEASLYCTQVTEGRNTRWQADVQYVPVRVRTQTAQEVAEVFQITFIDEATRRVMATMFTLHRPTGNDVSATLAAAVLGTTDEAGNFFGGLPEAIMWDNGGEFLNETLGHACAVLGIIPLPAPPYSGWRKGKIERFHRTSQQRFYAKLPGAVHGPKTFKGSRPWQGNPNELLFFDSLMAKALNGVDEYNDVHVHSVIGCTPNQAWLRDPTPIRRAPDAALHPLMLTLPRTRLVAKDGISYQNTKFVSPTLADWRRRKVEIRVLPHDVESVFVFDPENGKFICRATPAGQLSATERHRLLQRRADDYAAVRNAIRAGTDQRNRRRLIDDVLATEASKNDSDFATDVTTNPAPRDSSPSLATDEDILTMFKED